MKTLQKVHPDNVLLALLFSLIFLFAYTVSFGQGQLVMKGVVLNSMETSLRPYAEIIASNGEHMPLAIKPNGRFWVCAPANDRYILRFTQAGCVTKEVAVDARRSCVTGKCKDRSVEFDVVMDSAEGEEAMRYTSPVGRIEFRSTNGSAHVSHHYELVPVSSLLAVEAEH